MQFNIFHKIGRMHAWRQYIVYLHPQHARYYTPSPLHQASKPFTKFTRSRHVSPPSVSPKRRPDPLKVSRARQTEGLRGSKWRSKWHDWATEYRYIVYTFITFISGSTIFCYFALQRVPITGRRQLDFIPRWVIKRIEKSKLAEEDEFREVLTKCSLDSEHPAMQGFNSVFKRLVHASGLDDRDWDFRLVLAPSK